MRVEQTLQPWVVDVLGSRDAVIEQEEERFRESMHNLLAWWAIAGISRAVGFAVVEHGGGQPKITMTARLAPKAMRAKSKEVEVFMQSEMTAPSVAEAPSVATYLA